MDGLGGYGSSDEDAPVQNSPAPTSGSLMPKSAPASAPVPPPPKPSAFTLNLPPPKSTQSAPPTSSAEPTAKKQKVTVNVPLPSVNIKELKRDAAKDDAESDLWAAARKKDTAGAGSGLLSFLPPPKNPTPAAKPSAAKSESSSSSSSFVTKPLARPPPPPTAAAAPKLRPLAPHVEVVLPPPTESEVKDAAPATEEEDTGGFAIDPSAYEDVPAAGDAYPPPFEDDGSAWQEQSGVMGFGGTSALPVPAELLSSREQRQMRNVNFVDIKSSDIHQQTAAQQYQKYTQDVLKPESQINVDPNFMPSRVQRSRHQITFLAFEAKQKEQELLDRGLKSRQTKQEVRKKYGW